MWDRFDWDHVKVECLSSEQAGVILDLAETLLSLSFSWWKISPEASEISPLAHWWHLISVTASQRGREILWSQNKKIKPHFKRLFSFWRPLHWLVVSLKLGKFWKRVRLLMTFLQPSSYIVHGVGDRFHSTEQSWLPSALNYICCNLPEPKDFLQPGVVPCVLVKSRVGGSSHAESCSKDFEGNIFWREIFSEEKSKSAFSRKRVGFVLFLQFQSCFRVFFH